MSNYSLTTDSIPFLIRTIAIPASIGMFFKTMYNVVDTYFAGLLSVQSLSALSISFPIFFAIIAFASGVATAATVLIAAEKGKGNDDTAALYAQQIITFSIGCGMLLTILGISLSPLLFGLLGASGAYLDQSLLYMNTIYWGALFFVLNFAINGILNAVGDTTSFRNILIAGFLANIILSPVLMFGLGPFPEFGLQGIAIATVLIEALSALYLYIQACKKNLFGHITFSHLMPQWYYFKNILTQGVPSSLSMMAIGLGIFIITYFIALFGQAPVAAYGIATRIEQIFLLPMVGINIAAMSLISQNISAGHINRAKETIVTCYTYGSLIMIGATIIVFLLREQLMGIFTDDVEVIESGAQYLTIAAFATIAYVIHFMSDAILRGMQKPMIPLWMSIARQIIIPLTLFSFLITYLKYDINALWWGIFGVTWVSALFYLSLVAAELRKLLR